MLLLELLPAKLAGLLSLGESMGVFARLTLGVAATLTAGAQPLIHPLTRRQCILLRTSLP